MKFQPVYKCQLCGAFVPASDPVEGTKEFTQEALERVISDVGNKNPFIPNMPLYAMHDCNDGHTGLAIFSGFVCIPEGVQSFESEETSNVSEVAESNEIDESEQTTNN